MTPPGSDTALIGTAPRDIARAGESLRAGGLVAFSTETVYGLGADATAPAAVARIYHAKGRPSFNPLIAHVKSRAAAEKEGRFSRRASLLAEALWPGPLTLVVPRRAGGGTCDLACAGLASVGLRVPDHPVALALLDAADRPIAAPSANRSGRISPTQARHVMEDLAGRIDLVLDGGTCAVGVESTIIACLDDELVLLRPGGIPLDVVEEIAGPVASARSDEITAPGMLASHYAPRAGLRLDATDLSEGERGLDFGGRLAGATLDLSPTGDLREAAANLYGYLRQLDSLKPYTIAVTPVPNAGLGAAINDRLRRAAAPRG